ncbi:hypothetical protein GCM10010304_51900 [Streptomyces roseoviolaceus]
MHVVPGIPADPWTAWVVLAGLPAHPPLHMHEALPGPSIPTARALFSKALRRSDYCPCVWRVTETELSCRSATVHRPRATAAGATHQEEVCHVPGSTRRPCTGF